MPAKVLLDTDILSEVMKGKDPVVVEHARRYLTDAGQLTFSAMTVMEIVAGYSQQRREENLRRFLHMASRSDVIPFDTVVAELAGRIHADLVRMGMNIGVPDSAIAATAIHVGVPLEPATRRTIHECGMQAIHCSSRTGEIDETALGSTP